MDRIYPDRKAGFLMEGKKDFSCEAEEEMKEDAEIPEGVFRKNGFYKTSEPQDARGEASAGTADTARAGGAFADSGNTYSAGTGGAQAADAGDTQAAGSGDAQPADAGDAQTSGTGDTQMAGADEAQTSGGDEQKSGSEKGSFFRKKEKKDKKDEKIEELSDRVRRQMAEFDNFRKRTEKEKSQMFETGARSIIEKILPVIDNFERGLAALTEEEKSSAFADGMDKVYKQMMTVLEEAGVKVIETEGKEFDPNLHNAVMHIDDEDFGENIIAEEFQKGYMYRDSVVRHSMVKVAN